MTPMRTPGTISSRLEKAAEISDWVTFVPPWQSRSLKDYRAPSLPPAEPRRRGRGSRYFLAQDQRVRPVDGGSQTQPSA